MDDALRDDARAARAAIRAGDLRGDALQDAIAAVPFRDRDIWVDEALDLGEPPDDVAGLPPGTVPYVPCGVDAIVRAVRDAPVRERDVFVDLGAGIGRVALLVHLLTGARAIGVEMQAPLVAVAREAAARLGVTDVAMVLGDAAITPIVDGTVFFIYASFGPTALARILAALAQIAAHKRIVLCAVGFDVHGQDWLVPRASSSAELALYDSR